MKSTRWKKERPSGATGLGKLGGGIDLTGRLVEYWGHVWTITEKNYLGEWRVVRYEDRPDGRARITSTISARVLPEDHPHYAKLIETAGPPSGGRRAQESENAELRKGTVAHEKSV